jgi:hypothetical protein
VIGICKTQDMENSLERFREGRLRRTESGWDDCILISLTKRFCEHGFKFSESIQGDLMTS